MLRGQLVADQEPVTVRLRTSGGIVLGTIKVISGEPRIVILGLDFISCLRSATEGEAPGPADDLSEKVEKTA